MSDFVSFCLCFYDKLSCSTSTIRFALYIQSQDTKVTVLQDTVGHQILAADEAENGYVVVFVENAQCA